MKQAAVLGVDIGRVIIGADNDGVMFTTNYLEAAPVPMAFYGVAVLRERFNGQIILVSKAGPAMQAKTLHWLAHYDFWEYFGGYRTTIDPNVFFVRERADKARICKRKSVTHFIDDSREVLAHLREVVQNRYLFGPQGQRVARNERGLREVADWEAVLDRVWP